MFPVRHQYSCTARSATSSELFLLCSYNTVCIVGLGLGCILLFSLHEVIDTLTVIYYCMSSCYCCRFGNEHVGASIETVLSEEVRWEG